MKTTLKDIALAANLSTASVSLVLNGKPNKLSQESRSKIINLAQAMNYELPNKRPHVKLSASKTVALILPTILNPFFAEISEGVKVGAKEQGWQLIISTNDDAAEGDLKIIENIAKSKPKAIIIISTESHNNLEFNGFKFPIIQVDRLNPALTKSAVVLNHKKGGYLATRHLIELGHTKIACVTGPQKQASSRLRLKGYNWALEDSGIPISPNLIFECNYSSSGGYGIADEILMQNVTAVFSCNDMMALGIYKRFHELGIKIPDDISMVGFDNIEYTDLLDVPLTTIQQSGFDLGYAALQRAAYEIENPNAAKQTIQFEPELIIKNSTRAIFEG